MNTMWQHELNYLQLKLKNKEEINVVCISKSILGHPVASIYCINFDEL